jgi:hypothetical protein
LHRNKPEKQKNNKVVKASVRDEEEEEEDVDDGTQKKRKKWSVGPEYDEEAALQEALKKSTGQGIPKIKNKQK